VRILKFSRRATHICALATLLSGCGGSQLQNGPGALPPGAITQPHRPKGLHGEEPVGLSSYRVLFSFGRFAYGYRGAKPTAGLINVKGTLYGTTLLGGANDHGTIFSITKAGGEQVLYSFGGVSDGSDPSGALISAGGTLYGTASAGGTSRSYGTVFSLDTTGKKFRVLHTFGGGSDGADPMAGLVLVRGWLYGTTLQGGTGSAGKGTIFAIRLRDGKERILHRFSGGSDGAEPMAPLMYMNARLYGTTSGGGADLQGTVFSLSINTSHEHILHAFSGSDGASPEAGLLITTMGTLYGTTVGGGAYGEGTVFSVDIATSKERVLHSFSGTDGEAPVAGLVSTSGLLYGATSEGGAAGDGTIFSLDMNHRGGVLHSFHYDNNHDGMFPLGTLLRVKQRLYGTTYAGGHHHHPCGSSGYCDLGTVFALNV
jgi:uncharacterized repeat protein (TIGR03803 family)